MKLREIPLEELYAGNDEIQEELLEDVTEEYHLVNWMNLLGSIINERSACDMEFLGYTNKNRKSKKLSVDTFNDIFNKYWLDRVCIVKKGYTGIIKPKVVRELVNYILLLKFLKDNYEDIFNQFIEDYPSKAKGTEI